jgi:LysR family transcriptional regulator, nod-box dependent transcriptional activator
MRFHGLDLNLLVAFEALVKHRNVSAAAASVRLSQSAMSGALARLRTFFQDELLVQNGREMMLTPKAESLGPAVHQLLLQVQSTITNPPNFDPATSTRSFTIITSDYVHAVLLDDFIRRASRIAPGITFRILPFNETSAEVFDRGGADLFIVVDGILLPTHPARLLFEDEVVAICWAGNTTIGKHLTQEGFHARGHVTASPSVDQSGSLFDSMLREQGIERRIEVEVSTFSLMPGALVGTDRLALLHRRFAEYFAGFMPLRVLQLPFALPPIREYAQWHALRQRDQGLSWLLGEITVMGASLGEGTPDSRKEPGPLAS